QTLGVGASVPCRDVPIPQRREHVLRVDLARAPLPRGTREVLHAKGSVVGGGPTQLVQELSRATARRRLDPAGRLRAQGALQLVEGGAERRSFLEPLGGEHLRSTQVDRERLGS